jgi:energy-coupling factor transporter ATPase
MCGKHSLFAHLACGWREVFLFSEVTMTAELIRVADLHYTYSAHTDTPIPALCGVSTTVERGEYLVIVGHNGSGKSTLAKCLNGLLLPTQGDVWVKGRNTYDARALVGIRSSVGMVFQNPDNQFVASVVEEEVAFGPENLGLPREVLRQRVEQALYDTGLVAQRQHNPRTLSAGQKARLNIASILAMQPECLVLDESTAMLDPLARHDILDLLSRLHHSGLTIVSITHFMDELSLADRVLVLEQGRVALQGTPRAIVAQAEPLIAVGLALPPITAIAQGLRQRGADIDAAILCTQELVAAVMAVARVAL